MTSSQHARKIFSEIKEAGIIKYMRGQREHGGYLWDLSIPTMIASAKEEVLDQGSYLWTLEEQLNNLMINCLNLFESLEQREEPLAVEDQEIVNHIKGLLGAL